MRSLPTESELLFPIPFFPSDLNWTGESFLMNEPCINAADINVANAFEVDGSFCFATF